MSNVSFLKPVLCFMIVLGVLASGAIVYGGQANWYGFGKDAAAPESPAVSVLNSNYNGAAFELSFSGFAYQETWIKNDRFLEIEMPGLGQTGEIGVPRMPAYRRFVELPYCSSVKVEVEILERGEVMLPELGYDLEPVPVQPPVDKVPGAYENMELHYNPKVYSQSGVLFPLTARLGKAAHARGHRVALLEVFPMTYDPAEQILKYAKKVRVTLNYEGVNVSKTRRILERYQDRLFDRLVSSFVINPGSLTGTKDYPPAAPPSMLIIVHDDLESSIGPFASWKQMIGYDVTVANTTETGTSAQNIKDYIYTAFTTWPNPPVYVLLVGDTGFIPAWDGPHSYSETDINYSLLVDDDYLPDVSLGRWPVDTTADLDIVIEKTMAYGQVNVPDTTFYGHGVFIASSDWGQLAEQTHNYVIDNYLEPDGHTAHKVYEASGGSTSDIIENLNDGMSWCVYSGHGSPSGWGCVPFYQTNIRNDLMNENEYPLVSSHACSTNTYEDDECFGETWLIEEDKGGIGFWGASSGTQWDEDDIIEKGQFRGLVEDKLYAFAMTTDYGKYDLVIEYGWASNVYDYYDKYVVHGDPSIDPFTHIPTELNVTHDPTAPVGEVDFSVHVETGGEAVESALVNLVMDDEVLGVGYTDSSGDLTLTIHPEIAGEMDVIVTAHNTEPYYGMVTVAAQGCGIIVMDSDLYHCSATVEIHVWDTDLNIDPGVADTAEIDMSSDTEPTPEVVVITETGADTNEFVGTIELSETQGGVGYLMVSHEDTVTAHYHDEDCDGVPVDVYDEATTDCVGPVISGVSFSGVLDTTATINWTTDEASDSVVYYGLDTPPTESAADTAMVTEHSIVLEGLEQCSKYYFYVASSDASGNTAIDDNSGEYYFFNTLGNFVLLEENMDSDPGWTISGGDWEFGTPTGQGGEHGDPDPTSGYTGDNVYGYNLEGDYGNNMAVYHLTSPPLDCSNAAGTTLTFWRWLGVESPSYDHAVISVSNDGTTWTEYFHNTASMSDGDWVECSYDISATADGQPQVYIRWTMGPTDGSYVYCGWNIDDVEVAYLGPCDVPVLMHDDHGIDDSSGNDNGEANPGENILSWIQLYNNSSIDASNVSGTVTETSEHVTIINGDISFPDIPGHTCGLSNEPYLEWEVASDAPDGASIFFSIAWTSEEGSGTANFTELIVAPILEYADREIDDSSGNDDGIADPDESIVLPVLLNNSGHGTASNIIGTLSTTSEHITVTDSEAAWDDLPGETSEWSIDNFGFDVHEDAPEGEMVEFQLDVHADGYNDTFNFSIGIGAQPALVINDGSGTHAGIFTTVLGDNGFMVTQEDASATDPAAWPQYSLIIWSAGDNSEPVDNSSWRTNLQTFVAEGGRLLIEGGEVCYDFYYSDPAFLENVCHVTDWNGDSSGNLSLEAASHPVATTPYTLPATIDHSYDGYYDQDACDVAADAETVYGWTSASGGGLIAYDDDASPTNGGQIVFFSFSIGNVTDNTVRSNLIVNAARWIAGISGPVPTPTPSVPPTHTPTYTPTLTPTSILPTWTPTSTPTEVPPTYTPTYTPTEIPPTDTPTYTPTEEPPTFTPTPTPTLDWPTSTPTFYITTTPTEGTPTVFPSPTPTAITIKLILNQNMFHSNDEFILDCRIINPGPFVTLDQYIILDVAGNYWFYDNWTQDVDWVEKEIPAYSDEAENILYFVWPEDAGSFYGIKFWAGLLDDGFNIVGEIDFIEWGYE